jgi:hypothetical protein
VRFFLDFQKKKFEAEGGRLEVGQGSLVVSLSHHPTSLSVRALFQRDLYLSLSLARVLSQGVVLTDLQSLVDCQ